MATRQVRKKRNGKLRVHISETSAFPPAWRLTPENFAAAAKRYPALAKRIDATFGDALQGGDADLATAEVVLAGALKNDNLRQRAPLLQWVQSTSAGTEKFVKGFPTGITLTNNSGIHPAKGGEYVMTCLLMLNHRVPHFVTQQKEARWNPAFSSTIAGKTVVIVGTGAIGAASARLAKQFGLRVVGISRSGKKKPFFDRVHKARDIAKMFAKADFVVVCSPLTDETRGLVSQNVLDALPPHAGLINVGRGAVIDNNRLMAKLRAGELSGAILDVFPQEPLLADSEFWSVPNLIISPHCGVDDAREFLVHTYERFFSNLGRYLAGKKLTNIVDLKRGY